MRYLLAMLATVVLCFAAQSMALRAIGGRTAKSESNYFSSIARIQAGVRDNPDIMLLGSSITGRLPDRVNGFSGVVNLGCEGGSAVDTLRAIDQGILPVAPTIVIEGNTIFLAVGAGETEVAEAMRSRWFAVGLRSSSLSATARPAAFAYSALMARKVGSMGGGPRRELDLGSRPAVPVTGSPAGSFLEELLLEELVGVLGRLRSDGTSVLVVFYPQGRNSPPVRRKELAIELAARAGVPFWDLTVGLETDAVGFTDGTHLDPASATAVTMTLVSELGQ